ncbi:endolytic transglycosylase MltG [Azospirillum halopraeferens]|uniref:endolytic transglycosylase MltG n=1 Tax=Azospirillum halopraeferens TaxID=34010 RepID=UPI00041E1124|nr:endolytic transglycosylase MltG [Azospirillum halopraeferens]
MGWGLRIAAGALAATVFLAAVMVWAGLRVAAPGPLREAVTVVVPRGSGLEAIALTLSDAGVVESPLLFMAGARMTGAVRALKAGEYAFAPGVSIDGVLKQLRQGRTVVRRLTVPEGLTVAQVLTLLGEEPALSGEIRSRPPEGSLLPETYHFSYGDSREGMIARMTSAMDAALAEAWSRREEGLPFATPAEALTLASIVEKETSVAEERARVAGVFVNRLKGGMRLQSDPTVIYALTDGSGDLGRPLTRADWKYESDYNTYFADGLPPGPIANPGRAAIEAVLKPDRHDFFYFVADGTGGHAFSRTLAEHNRNVTRWRAVQRRQTGEGTGN